MLSTAPQTKVEGSENFMQNDTVTGKHLWVELHLAHLIFHEYPYF